jgi:Fe-S cluster biosynthesis and repair protein YggX
MAGRNVMCAKLGRELPAIDETTPEGQQALRMVLMIGGRELQQKVHSRVSAEAWKLWKDQMVMIFNEFRLDPTSEQANQVLRQFMEAFFFGEGAAIPNYVPPPGH